MLFLPCRQRFQLEGDHGADTEYARGIMYHIPSGLRMTWYRPGGAEERDGGGEHLGYFA